MSRTRTAEPAAAAAKTVRCAVYTRKSSDEGLDQSFNSLDAQRESAESFIASRRHEGWVCVPERYDDGGYSGGTTNRPALQRLLADIEAGRVDVIVVYKIDRLSRSLADFCRLAERFEKRGVSFVSITQQLDSSTSSGRLMLHMLLSFAQFERELASERTRDKIALARKRGKWAGGRPLLGYDIDRGNCRLVVNETEAVQVRTVFAEYIERQSLNRTVEALAARGITNKRWTTKAGQVMGGRAFDKAALSLLLSNVAFLGQVRHKDAAYKGEHPPIVDEATWERAQSILRVNGRSGGTAVRNRYGALLKGMLFCGPCGRPMGHTFTTKAGGKGYRYYSCSVAQTKGWHACSSKSVPAEEIERFVVERLKGLGRDRELVARVLACTRQADAQRVQDLESSVRAMEKECAWLASESARCTAPESSERVAELAGRDRDVQGRLREARLALDSARSRMATHDEVAGALTRFEPVWESLSPRERAEVIGLLVQRVEFDGSKGEVRMTFHADTPEAAIKGRAA